MCVERGGEIQLQDYILKYYQKDIYAHMHVQIYLIFFLNILASLIDSQCLPDSEFHLSSSLVKVCQGEASARSTWHRAARGEERCQLNLPGHAPGPGVLGAT